MFGKKKIGREEARIIKKEKLKYHIFLEIGLLISVVTCKCRHSSSSATSGWAREKSPLAGRLQPLVLLPAEGSPDQHVCLVPVLVLLLHSRVVVEAGHLVRSGDVGDEAPPGADREEGHPAMCQYRGVTNSGKVTHP